MGGPDWKGILNWSLQHSDGTSAPREIGEDERRWFAEAVQNETVDEIKRMKEITDILRMSEIDLEQQGVSPEDLEGLLEELQEHVESIDMANDLQALGSLAPLLAYLHSPHACLRARAAEVVATAVQNNPRSQTNVMAANGLPLLMENFSSDSDLNSRSKALGAISSLIRHNQPGVLAFKHAGGYKALNEALCEDHQRLQRKALQVLQYLLQDSPSDSKEVAELGFAFALAPLVGSPDADIRQAALLALVELISAEPKLASEIWRQEIRGAAGNEPGPEHLLADQVSQSQLRNEEDSAGQSSGLHQVGGTLCNIVNDRIGTIGSLPEEDRDAAREELQLLDVIWQKCEGHGAQEHFSNPSQSEPIPTVSPAQGSEEHHAPLLLIGPTPISRPPIPPSPSSGG